MSIVNQVSQLYIGILGRAADRAGLEYWVQQVQTGKLTIEGVAKSFQEQPEWINGNGQLDRAGILNELYKNLFGREATGVDNAYWVLGEGASVPLEKLVLALIAPGAALGNDALVLAARTDAAVNFSFSDVDTTDLDAAAAAITGVTTGSTFTLTTGVDTGPAFVGTAGNDTFVAGYDSVGNSTLTAFDTLNGAGGVDTLNVVTAKSLDNVPGVSVSNIENVNFQVAGDLGGEDSFDMSAWTGVERLNVLATGSADLVSAASISVTVQAGEGADVEAVSAQTVTVTAGGDADVVAGDATVTVTAGDDAWVSAGAGTVTVTAGDDATVVGRDGTDITITAGTVGNTWTNVDVIGEDIDGLADLGDVTVSMAGEDADFYLTAASVGNVTVSGANDDVHITAASIGTVTINSAIIDGGEDVDYYAEVDFDVATEQSSLNLVLAGDVDFWDENNSVEDGGTIETINLTVNGTLQNRFDVRGNDALTSLVIDGAGDLSLRVDTGEDSSMESIDASEATGDIDVSINAAVTSYAGGSGVDTVTVERGVPVLGEGDVWSATVGGGEGDQDRLIMSTDVADMFLGEYPEKSIANSPFSGFEILELTWGTAQRTVNAANFGVNTVVLNFNSWDDLSQLYVADGTRVVFEGDADIDYLDVTDEGDDPAESVTLELVGGIDAEVDNLYDFASVTIVSNTTGEDGDNSLSIGNLEEATELVIQGNADLKLEMGLFDALGEDDTLTVDGSTFDASLWADFSGPLGEDVALDITLGDGDNFIVGNEDGVNTITVGNGNNVIYGGALADTITLGTGYNNVLVYGDYSYGETNANSQSSGLNIDTIIGFNANGVDHDNNALTPLEFNVFNLTAFLGYFHVGAKVDFLGVVSNIVAANTALQVQQLDEELDIAGNLQVLYISNEKQIVADLDGSGDINDNDLVINLVDLVGVLSQNNFVESALVG